MAVRVRYKVEVYISSSPAGEEDLGKPVASIISDMIGEGGTRKTTIASGEVDKPVSLADVETARFLWIRVSALDPTQTLGAITLRKNSNLGEAIEIEPLPGAKEAQLVLTTNNITSLFVSNPGVAVELTIGIAGD